jgi:hypothetical protein
MLPIQRMPRRSTLWGAAFLSLVPLHVTAQVQTTVAPSLPSLTPEDKSPNDPEAIYCRPPQAQTESRMLGPRVCKKNKEWDALHAQGLDISADGRKTVASEKYRNLHRNACQSAQDGCL